MISSRILYLLHAKIAAKKLVIESEFHEKIRSLTTKEEIKLATKAELEAEQYKTVKLQISDLCIFIGQSYFINDEAQI